MRVTKLSDDVRVQDVALADIDGEDYLYFVDHQTKQTFRLALTTLLAWLEQELEIAGGGIPAMDPVPGAGEFIVAGVDDEGAPDGSLAGSGFTGADFFELFAGKADKFLSIGAGAQTSAFSLAPGNVGAWVTVAATVDPVPVTVPSTLWQTGGSGRGAECHVRITAADSPVTFVGDGLTLSYLGKDPADIPFAAGDLVRVIVTSATTAQIITDSVGTVATAAALAAVLGAASAAAAAAAAAQADALDAKAPLVKATHTAATKTLAAGDAGASIPIDSTNNPIAVTVPASLFGSAGAGRAFVCQLPVVGFVGAITFPTSGGLTLEPYGKAAVTAVDDIVTLYIESATKGRIHIGAKL